MPLPPPELDGVRARRCVVTGGLGFIGSNLALALAANGAHVTVVDALIPQHGGDRRNLPALAPGAACGPITVIEARIDDESSVATAVAGAEIVFNLAGQVSHHESMLDPLRDLDLNARSHLGLLELLRRHAPDAVVVHTSTRQVYGRPRYLPVDEEHPTQPVDINGVDKLAGEQFHLIYNAVHGLKTTALRLTNVYGPRQCLSKDGLGFLPVFVRRAMRNETISLFGDGQQLRDCLHVHDVVRALVLAAITADAVGEVFNLGHAQSLSLQQIGELVIDAAGAGSLTHVPWPDELARIDIGSFHGDYAKAKRVLGWEPDVSFDDGIADTVAYYREHSWYLSPT